MEIFGQADRVSKREHANRHAMPVCRVAAEHAKPCLIWVSVHETAITFHVESGIVARKVLPVENAVYFTDLARKFRPNYAFKPREKARCIAVWAQ